MYKRQNFYFILNIIRIFRNKFDFIRTKQDICEINNDTHKTLNTNPETFFYFCQQRET